MLNETKISNDNLLTRELTIEEQKLLLSELFGFDCVNIGDEKNPHYIIYDDEGNEFYGSNENLKFSFTTLNSFFMYAKHIAKNSGYYEAQQQMRLALGIK